MKNTNFKTTVGALLIALGASTTYAQPPQGKEGRKPPTVDQLFKEMDANKDGKLSKVEIKGPLKEDFAKVDTNKDGFITKEELNKAPRPEGRKTENRK